MLFLPSSCIYDIAKSLDLVKEHVKLLLSHSLVVDSSFGFGFLVVVVQDLSCLVDHIDYCMFLP